MRECPAAPRRRATGRRRTIRGPADRRCSSVAARPAASAPRADRVRGSRWSSPARLFTSRPAPQSTTIASATSTATSDAPRHVGHAGGAALAFAQQGAAVRAGAGRRAARNQTAPPTASAGAGGEQQHPPVDRRSAPRRGTAARGTPASARDRRPATRPTPAPTPPRPPAGASTSDFREQLPREPAEAGAEREPHRKFAPPRQCAPELQVGDVDAGDQQDQRHRAHQRRQHRF